MQLHAVVYRITTIPQQLIDYQNHDPVFRRKNFENVRVTYALERFLCCGYDGVWQTLSDFDRCKLRRAAFSFAGVIERVYWAYQDHSSRCALKESIWARRYFGQLRTRWVQFLLCYPDLGNVVCYLRVEMTKLWEALSLHVSDSNPNNSHCWWWSTVLPRNPVCYPELPFTGKMGMATSIRREFYIGELWWIRGHAYAHWYRSYSIETEYSGHEGSAIVLEDEERPDPYTEAYARDHRCRYGRWLSRSEMSNKARSRP